MRIIPAIDILNGTCVRLSKGDYSTSKIYNKNPLEVAKSFEDSGIKFLHLVDLDGAKSSHIVNHKVLEQIASKTNLIIDFGGGLKTNKDAEIAFECGASQITGGSIAIHQPAIFKHWIITYGPKKVILGADIHSGKDGKKIAISGWIEKTMVDLIPFIIEYQTFNIAYVICTDISKDGMLKGPATCLYKNILKETEKLKLIASGGISSIDDLLALKEAGCEGAIIGKAIYENKISLKELEKFISNN
ncbi:MAG: 1-(5-phosphoribosyl)-5-[(5-phosphoribosylamino)methylideneamino]imidazole-4-carboxamide isomerase [Flavobacteriaceae bacterium CG_4_8_14_3_um_filter_34_10]|nr:1-(5-phosphoribosyl)-5-[(5-phosphoribosylamino)methylideneamino]imidazole-4-carboxamide isomerase [Flavobacteriia bacterium]OIP52332.1 MAG: 1-(5-phosphoribosyl)-5-[(5-phosphoribosylamino)methylideneamino]imidazole-4-carboxamide isomerase [Flavobacteriaceae bacterium CG2_30_34_30]PIQ17785.1 MAG: 1-(5-phosphoribosyl)-5-[(5-phosphoribosylamino)methylideneamino]imidazole-4-carboxamide isomerase [Flavobacteriaceae bacterium CG18_big_fil_WC_8_21_14_2_50_34_36]PIV50156.1 MAG: 1-(5-phosphoribosyl)-5-